MLLWMASIAKCMSSHTIIILVDRKVYEHLRDTNRRSGRMQRAVEDLNLVPNNKCPMVYENSEIYVLILGSKL